MFLIKFYDCQGNYIHDSVVNLSFDFQVFEGRKSGSLVVWRQAEEDSHQEMGQDPLLGKFLAFQQVFIFQVLLRLRPDLILSLLNLFMKF